MFTSHKELLPIQVHSEAEAEELAEIAKTSNRLWVVCAPPSKSEGDEEDEDSTAKAAVLFRFMRCIQVMVKCFACYFCFFFSFR